MATVGGEDLWARIPRCALRRRDLLERLAEASPLLLPGLRLIPIELIKYNANDEYVTDLALVDEIAGHWWLGSVITKIDDFELDLLAVVRSIQRVKYTAEDLDAVVAAAQDPVDRVALRGVLSARQPDAVAFVSNPEPHWFQHFATEDANLAILELFNGPAGSRLVRLNGKVPQARGTLIGQCVRLPGPGSPLKLERVSPAASLPDVLQIEWSGETSAWKAQSLDDYDLLHSSAAPADLPQSLGLWKLGDNAFALRSD